MYKPLSDQSMSKMHCVPQKAQIFDMIIYLAEDEQQDNI